MKEKPDPLFVDGEIFKVVDKRDDPDIGVSYVRYAHGNFSPYEVQLLRDWLTSFLEWDYNSKHGGDSG